MPVYAKKLSPEWRKAFEEFESHTGFEMMHQDAVDAGEMTPREAWNANQKWLELHTIDAACIETPDDFYPTEES